jgi:hypothetical protein
MNALPRGTAYLFLRTFPPLAARELEVQDWIRIWYAGSEYQQQNHQLYHDFRTWISGIHRLSLTGSSLRELTPSAIKENLLFVNGLHAVTDLLVKDILMARELERENVREQVNATTVSYYEDSEANISSVDRNKSHG